MRRAENSSEIIVAFDYFRCYEFVKFLFLLTFGDIGSISEYFESALGYMAERPVTYVMEKRCKSNKSLAVDSDIECISHLPGDVSDADRMIESRMKCTWIDQTCECELSDSAKSL